MHEKVTSLCTLYLNVFVVCVPLSVILFFSNSLSGVEENKHQTLYQDHKGIVVISPHCMYDLIFRSQKFEDHEKVKLSQAKVSFDYFK